MHIVLLTESYLCTVMKPYEKSEFAHEMFVHGSPDKIRIIVIKRSPDDDEAFFNSCILIRISAILIAAKIRRCCSSSSCQPCYTRTSLVTQL